MCERSQAPSISIPGKLKVGRKYRIIIISFYQISGDRAVQNRNKAGRKNLRIANYDEQEATIFFPWCNSPQWTRAFLLSRLHDYSHLDRPHSVGLT